MLPIITSETYIECHSPEYAHDYSPIKIPRNGSLDKIEIKEFQNLILDKFKLKLRHTSTLPIYEKEEEEKHQKTPKKPKKQLKLVTNARLDDEMEKSKSFSPQPKTNHSSSIKIHSNFFSFFPLKSFKRVGSLPQTDDFHYFEEFYDVTTSKGSYKHQQDRFVVNLNDKLDLNKCFFGVFDGHRTATVAEFLCDNLIQYIQNNKYYDIDPEKAINEGFHKLDEEFLNYQKKTNSEGGSTALCALIKGNSLYIMNLGDSIAAIIKDENIVKINEEHNTGNEKERLKMEKKGALIIKIKNVHRILGEIAVTRSFGDRTYKEYLICEPDVYIYDMNEFQKDGVLLLGTDGFWNLCSLEKTMNYVKKWRVENGNKIEGLTEFLFSEVFLNFENVKKDNMTLVAIDLVKISKKFRKIVRTNSDEEEKEKNKKVLLTTKSEYLPPEKNDFSAFK